LREAKRAGATVGSVVVVTVVVEVVVVVLVVVVVVMFDIFAIGARVVVVVTVVVGTGVVTLGATVVGATYPMSEQLRGTGEVSESTQEVVAAGMPGKTTGATASESPKAHGCIALAGKAVVTRPHKPVR